MGLSVLGWVGLGEWDLVICEWVGLSVFGWVGLSVLVWVGLSHM